MKTNRQSTYIYVISNKIHKKLKLEWLEELMSDTMDANHLRSDSSEYCIIIGAYTRVNRPIILQSAPFLPRKLMSK